jgi:hypothetical protein
MAKSKKLKIEVCDIETIEQITDLFDELLTDYKSQCATWAICSSADIEYELDQINNRTKDYKQRLVNIFSNG